MKRLLLAGAVVIAAACHAGIKYWDNPDFRAFDVGDYVQDGLVLNYDGIRNAGLGQPHSTSSAQWKNLTATTYDMAMDWVSYTGSSDSSITRTRGNTTQGQWNGSNGFVFNGRVCFMKWNNQSGADAVVIPAQYTMQFAMTAAAADQSGDGQTGYLFTPHSDFDWNNGGVAVRSSENSGVTPANAIYAVDLGRIGDQSKRPHFSDANPKYVTVLENSSSLCVFGGTVLPSSGDSGYVALNGTATERRNNWIAIGGLGKRTATTKDGFQGFNGTLHSYRLYSRALTEEELAWNRVVDEKRFFGTQLPIPATNAVVRSNLRLVSGPEPVGCYAVDASGYTFTAPVTTNLNGHTYTLLSATKETWSAGVWGAAEAVAVGANGASVAVASSELVRISWKWQPVGGAFTAADYSIDDIVTDGLVLHYDGILNNGIGKTHDDASLYWQNLAEGYEDWPLVRVEYRDNDNDGSYDAARSIYYSTHAGEWSADGFVFDGYECMMKWNDSGDHRFVLYPECTFQFAMTASTADQAESNGGISYLFFPRNDLAQGDWQGGSISIRSTADANIGIPADSVLMTDSARYGSTDIRPSFSNPNPRFANVVADSAAVRVFEGVKWPTSGNGYKAGVLSTSRTSNWFAIGGQYNPQTGRAIKNFQGFHGTLHSIRYYDRALAEWELKRNREVDSARFFGELATTNVLVMACGGTQAETGAYKVEGEWTFTAATTVNKRGETVPVERYTVETLVNGAWVNKQAFNGNSYTYTEGTSPATVRLTWIGPPPGLVISVK